MQTDGIEAAGWERGTQGGNEDRYIYIYIDMIIQVCVCVFWRVYISSFASIITGQNNRQNQALSESIFKGPNVVSRQGHRSETT